VNVVFVWWVSLRILCIHLSYVGVDIPGLETVSSTTSILTVWVPSMVREGVIVSVGYFRVSGNIFEGHFSIVPMLLCSGFLVVATRIQSRLSLLGVLSSSVGVYVFRCQL
jgi:hypothetical protein